MMGRGQAWKAASVCCPAGHRFTAANTQVNTRGARTCRQCKAEQSREFARRHPYYSAARKYGITEADVAALLADPCAICGAQSTDIDHDHDTGEVRKALCAPCNRGLGQFGDDLARLRSAVDYLAGTMVGP